MTAPPAWALALIRETCEQYEVPVPDEITWYRSSRHGSSSGRTSCHPDRRQIHVTAGSDKTDQKFVVLHELAHWITKSRLGPYVHHSAAFWVCAFDLYNAHLGITAHAIRREPYAGALREANRRAVKV